MSEHVALFVFLLFFDIQGTIRIRMYVYSALNETNRKKKSQ